jgi:ribosomal protein S27AE
MEPSARRTARHRSRLPGREIARLDTAAPSAHRDYADILWQWLQHIEAGETQLNAAAPAAPVTAGPATHPASRSAGPAPFLTLRHREQQAAMAPETFTCPRCGTVTIDAALARLGYCGNCREFTGLCDADFIGGALLATGVVGGAEWRWPCTAPGPEHWRVSSQGGAAADVLLCTSHGDYLLRGGAEWMAARGLRLAFLGTGLAGHD